MSSPGGKSAADLRKMHEKKIQTANEPPGKKEVVWTPNSEGTKRMYSHSPRSIRLSSLNSFPSVCLGNTGAHTTTGYVAQTKRQVAGGSVNTLCTHYCYF
jgi:hypothetical protein